MLTSIFVCVQVELYQQHGQHTDAMETLRVLSCSPRALSPSPAGASVDLRGEPGVWRALKYLREMPHDDSSALLICGHTQSWLLQADAEGTIDVRSSALYSCHCQHGTARRYN